MQRPQDSNDRLLEMLATYSGVRSLLDLGGQNDVEIYADIPIWYDSSSSIGWTDPAQRDQWFTQIAVPLDGLTMMAYERSALSSIINGVTYEANNFDGEVRVGLNNKEIGPGDTFETFAEYTAMVDALEGDIGIEIGGVDHHTFYLLAEYSPEPTISADFNEDGDVDGDDFLILQGGYGLTESAALSDGDADGNEAVNVFDWLAWEQQYATPPSLAAGVVPEPNTAALVAIAFIFAGRYYNTVQ